MVVKKGLIQRRAVAVAGLVAIFLLSACDGGATGAGIGVPNIELAAFGPQQTQQNAVKAAVPNYSLNIADLPKAEQDQATKLSAPALAALTTNGFVVDPSDTSQQFYDLYSEREKDGSNIFVSSDAVLHTYHMLYDYNLRTVEQGHFVDDLKAITTTLQHTAQTQYMSTTGDVKEAARLNLAFFSVAAKLLDPSATVPDDVRDVVNKEIALIQAHTGIDNSPIFGYEEDYSQYVPRGHYTRSDALKSYFTAMMWYGRIGFHLQPQAGPVSGRRETREALLMLLAMGDKANADALQRWQKIYSVTSFLVGKSDDLSLADYATVARKTFTSGLSLPELANDSVIDSFISEAAKLPGPKINGEIVSDNQDVAKTTRAFRFMGQRFIPDGYIQGQLIYDMVGTQSDPRYLPMGLDVPAAFGSDRAAHILTDTYNQTHYAHYQDQMSALKATFAGLPAAQWGENVYWGWLDSLRTLTAPVTDGYPRFMQNTAWTDKNLATFLGSWTELRHDTILYAKQPYMSQIMVIVMPPPKFSAVAYLEPNPALYSRLLSLTQQTEAGMKSQGVLDADLQQRLDAYTAMLTRFLTITNAELANKALSADDISYLRGIGEQINGLTTFAQNDPKHPTTDADNSVAVVADIATDPNKSQVQEEATGPAQAIYVIALVNGQPRLCVGAMYSYYEFAQPLSNRLTDEAWQAMTPRPAQPQWVNSFVK